MIPPAVSPLRILLIEDEEFDQALIARQLRRDGFSFVIERAENGAAMTAAIAAQPPDIILSDYSLPAFSGTDALAVRARLAPAVPFIMVTGSLDEERAVDCIKAGADDYVLKDRIARLGPAVRGALEKRSWLADQGRLVEQLREDAERHQAMFESNLAVKWLVDPESGRIVEVNQAACDFYGYDRATLTAMNVSGINTLPENQVHQILTTVKDSGTSRFEFRHRLADGSVREVLVYANPIMLRGRRLIYSIIHDITERKAVECHLRDERDKVSRQLRHSRALNDLAREVLSRQSREAILAAMMGEIGQAFDPDRAALYEVDLEAGIARGLHEWRNPSLPGVPSLLTDYDLRLFPATVNDLLRRRAPIISHADRVYETYLRDGTADLIHRDRGSRSILLFPFSFTDKGFFFVSLDELRHYREWQPEELEFLSGAAAQVALGLQKITLLAESRAANIQLTDSEGRYRRLLEQLQAGVMVIGVDGCVRMANPAAAELLGRTEAALIGSSCAGPDWDVVAADGAPLPAQEMPAMIALTEDRAVSGMLIGVAKPGQRDRVWLMTNAVPRHDAEGRVSEAVCTFQDITAYRALQAELRHRETLASLGEMVAGIAHEVRNPVFGALGALDALEAKVEGRVEILAFTTLLRAELKRIGAFMDDLLSYGRPALPEQAPVPLSAAISAAVRDSALLASTRGVRVRVLTAGLLPMLPHDSRLLAQAVRNLVDNALQHETPGGEVVVACGRDRGSDGAEFITLAVRDRGPGFTPEDLARAGEPFFTRRRGGTGLGLAIVRRIVEGHGGSLRIANREGGGCEAVIHLPLPAARI